MSVNTAVVAVLNDRFFTCLICTVGLKHLLFSFVILNGLTSVQSTACLKDAD